MRPKVSIIITCYNDGAFVEKAVKSALDQTIHNKEVIVVDDGSDAETKIILNVLQEKVDKLIIQKNQGVSAARNNGIQRSTGEFILILDSDDYFEPGFCEKALVAFQERKNLCLVTCYARWFDMKNDYQIHKPMGGELKNFLFRNCALGNSMFLKKDWKRVGGYDELMLKGWEDWEFFIRLHKEGGMTYVIPEILFHYRKKKNSRTTIANQNRYDLLRYIILKNEELYKEFFTETIDHLIEKIEKGEIENKLKKESIEYKIGYSLLKPVRLFKKYFINKGF